MSLLESPPPNVPMPPAEDPAIDQTEFEIRARPGWVALDIRELIHFRELLYYLVWRDVKVRYKQTILGFAWAIIQPVTNMLITTLIFGVVMKQKANMPAEVLARNTPYALYVYAGLLAWMFFSNGVSGGSTSLINASGMITKIYFPRLFVPAAVIGASLVDMLISFGVFLCLMVVFHFVPPWTILLTPLLLILLVFATLGLSFALSALTVTYRDFRYVIPFVMGALTFPSAVYYPLDFHNPWIHWGLRLNPVYGIIGGLRSCMLGQHWDLMALGIATVEIVGFMLFGLFYFKKTERRFADIA